MKSSALSLTWPRLGGGLLLCLFTLQPALSAERVGVAAAVKPAATSQPPGGETSTLRIRKSVVYDERINTSGSGVVQVLLLDGSTFTVGPGSSLVIDKFVYNPSIGRGELVASFSKTRSDSLAASCRSRARRQGQDACGRAHRARRHCADRGPRSEPRRCGSRLWRLSRPRARRQARQTEARQYVRRVGPGTRHQARQHRSRYQCPSRCRIGPENEFAGTTPKGKSWQYYGIHPTGAYPDEPFVKELYYSNASTGLILSGATRVPRLPPMPPPPPQEPPTRPPVIDGPGLNNLR
jgi:hypothetical protein